MHDGADTFPLPLPGKQDCSPEPGKDDAKDNAKEPRVWRRRYSQEDEASYFESSEDAGLTVWEVELGETVECASGTKWQRRYSVEDELHYFVNEETGDSVWNLDDAS